MAIPQAPWAARAERILAPTETAADVTLLLVIAISLWVLIKGDAKVKAALAVWWVVP